MLVFNILLLHHVLHSTVQAAAVDTIPRYALPAGDASSLVLSEEPSQELELYSEDLLRQISNLSLLALQTLISVLLSMTVKLPPKSS